ncbi:folylpolyglutamate synthase/dihydrofolate synthase family protein [Rhizobium sp. L1K21]|uniref:bifunctional folylpolyglutamate synthase/dihydrofolate synthase n=1 Tax=Rhizobium sp. L1K21 TaxID=2954933 RepID=UPI002093D985|nr:folylpolyglutamate synthase/dihydrofolate synthase family protein [Rhizobium sp. L1K21]MCO6187986.1 bifunctional folylpolyglutamate synthase/dihydrofolate synthase [Rhizobium sp. L1K21]
MVESVDESEAVREIDKLMALHPKGFDMSLDRILRLLDKLGNPHLKLPPVIHIAGTNGKGSATAFSRALLEAGGYAVHIDTSPHLVRWHERYRIGRKGQRGEFVSDADFADALRRVAKVNDGQTITVFEILTAVSFLLFSEKPADAVILEVGMGGRFDSTNVVPNPAVSVIMPVSMDHQAYLGDRVELIAAEKAGIMKPGCPVVIGRQEFDGAREVLVDTAERLRCPLSVYGQDFAAHEEFGRLIYQDEFGLADLPLPRLPGRHQIANAAAAIRAVKAAGFEVTETIMEKAMISVEWPARMQRLNTGRLFSILPPGSELWVDGGHNPSAGTVITEMLAGMEERDPRPLYLVAGMLNTKDTTGYFKTFEDITQLVLTVPISGSDAAVDPVALAADAADAGLTTEPHQSLRDALEAIRAKTARLPVAPRVLIGGSLYLAGEALRENGTIPD